LLAAELVKQHEMQTEIVEEPAATGVGRYIQTQIALAKNKLPVSKVAKYLAQQIVMASKKPVKSGVEKYLLKQRTYAHQKKSISGVSKYIEKQALVANKRPVVSGVAHYISKQQRAPAKVSAIIIKTGVSQYMQRQSTGNTQSEGPSGVTRYVAKQSRLRTSKLIKSADFEKSLEGEYLPAGDIRAETGVTRYIDAQVLSVNKRKSAVSSISTGVDKYLASSVGKRA
jgi:hypothetical protein